MILQNQVRCNKCGDEPYSAHRHDFKYCKCGSVAVDGGMEYLRRVGDFKDCVDMSYSMDRDVVEACVKAIADAKETGRNDLGIFLAVIRTLRNYDLVQVH